MADNPRCAWHGHLMPGKITAALPEDLRSWYQGSANHIWVATLSPLNHGQAAKEMARPLVDAVMCGRCRDGETLGVWVREAVQGLLPGPRAAVIQRLGTRRGRPDFWAALLGWDLYAMGRPLAGSMTPRAVTLAERRIWQTVLRDTRARLHAAYRTRERDPMDDRANPLLQIALSAATARRRRGRAT